MARKKVLHLRSSVVEGTGVTATPKLPTSDQIEIGEIAVNFAKGYETLSIKNASGDIVTFTNDNYWADKEKVVAAALNDLNGRKLDASGLTVALDGKADVDHTHEISGVTGLQAALNSKVSGLTLVTGNVVNPTNGVITIPSASTSTYGLVEVDNAISDSSTNPVQNNVVYSELSEKFDGVLYDSNSKHINFYSGGTGGTIISYVDATAFIKDGMVDNVEVKDVTIQGETVKCLVITFNTDSGKEDINIPLSEVFDSSLYYTKDETDALLSGKVSDVQASGVSIVNANHILVVDTELDSGSTNPVTNAAITNTIYDNETVTAAALVDLDDRKADMADVDALSLVVNNINTELMSGVTVPTKTGGTTSLTVTDKVVAIPAANANDYGVVVVDDGLSGYSTNPVQNSIVTNALAGKSDSGHTHEISGVTGLQTILDNAASSITLVTGAAVTPTDGDITIPAATSGDYGLVIVDEVISSASTNPVQNKVIYNIIEEDERVMAGALNDLNDRLDELFDMITALSGAVATLQSYHV